MTFQKRKNVPKRISKFWLPVTGVFLSESTYGGIPISRTLGQPRTSQYLESNLVSLGFASLNLYNFPPDFSKLPITQTNVGSGGTNWPSITRTYENCAMQSACLTHSAFLLMMRTSIICAKSTRNISQIIDQSFSVAKWQQVIANYFS